MFHEDVPVCVPVCVLCMCGWIGGQGQVRSGQGSNGGGRWIGVPSMMGC